MKQILLRFKLPNKAKPLQSHAFREMVALAANGISLFPPSFFHYGNDGKPLSQGDPDIRFVSGQHWVGILSKSGNADQMISISGFVSMLLSRYFNEPVPMQIEEHDYGFAHQDYPTRYYFRSVVSKKGRMVGRTDSDESLIKQALLRRLAVESAAMGFDLPLDEQLAIQVLDVRSGGMPLHIANGVKTAQYVHVMNGELAINLKISGIFQFGNLQSRGHGRLILSRGAPC